MSDFFVFVDESGDLGALGSKYFIVAAVQVVDEKHLGRIIKKARQRILNRKLADVTELKAVKSTPEIRRFVLGKIASLDCKIYVLAVEKKRIAAGLMAVQDRLYNWLCRLLCQQLPPGNLRLIFDKKYTNPARRKQFDEYIARQLAQRNIKTSIQHLESHACTPLQAVDFVAWAANRKYSHNDGSYYSLISGKIANQGGSELWNRD